MIIWQNVATGIFEVLINIVVCLIHDAGDGADVSDGPIQGGEETQDEAHSGDMCRLLPPRSAALYS
ncbi:hypothetical protein LSAT2_026247, partial [Lamellibrachia satsuma]